MTTPVLGLSDFWMSPEEDKSTSTFQGLDSTGWRFARWKTNQYVYVIGHDFHFLNHNVIVVSHQL